MELQKTLKDLNLLDRFLFAEAMEDPEILKSILEIILGKDIVLKHLPQTEKEKRKAVWSKQIRLDVWAMDTDDIIYDTEVQKRNTRNIPKRTRFYHALIDSKLLEPGDIDYNKLNDAYIIMIMPFDLFGENLYKYTFQMTCDEVPGLKLDDGATRIFLNTHGSDPSGVSTELIDLLQYFEQTTADVAEKSASKKILKMQEKIEAIKGSEEIGVKQMNAWEEKILDRQEARAEGLAEGLAEGRESGLVEGKLQEKLETAKKMLEKKMSVKDIAEITDLSENEIRQL